jgi:DNA replication and repair protein RecF
VLGRFSPARATLSAEYGAAIAQRNASLRRIGAGFSTRDALAPWSERVATLGTELVSAREEATAQLGPPFAERADELGLADATLHYDGDIERGATGIGPHLDDIVIASRGRELRSFGSQGEQRLAVLALLLAEAELIADRRGTPPLLLLDDVLSELDPGRRRILASRVAASGQALVTATDPSLFPALPSQLLEVRPGEVHDRTTR